MISYCRLGQDDSRETSQNLVAVAPENAWGTSIVIGFWENMLWNEVMLASEVIHFFLNKEMLLLPCSEWIMDDDLWMANEAGMDEWSAMHLDLVYVVAFFNPVVDLWLEKTASRKHPETWMK